MPDSELGISPHEVIFGYRLSLPFDMSIKASTKEPGDILDFVSYPNKTRVNIWSDAWTRTRAATVGPKVREDYARGQSVYVYQRPQHKSDSQWIRGTILNPIGSQCYEVELANGTRQVFHKDHLKSYIESAEEKAENEAVQVNQKRETENQDCLYQPPFVAWKDTDGKVKIGAKLSWTNDDLLLVHEHQLLEDRCTVVPMYFTADGVLRIGGPPEIPVTVTVSPRQVSALRLETPARLTEDSMRKVSAL
ncbi:hypothetical protein FOL47_010175 [Perkinsus chesapeaki]|uniref:Uncharacterized protein n=1 Tax=Perkinsus chesapeaki TaxID=330153 RepID=A0A7J6L3H7_PERCH|nr:hypothetical protein FOL47_010175 [Perkinsus chesapeaki]